VHAIVDREIEEARSILDRLSSAEDVVSAILEVFARWTRADEDEAMSPALFLEIVAVSSRDPELAAAMQHADREIRERLAAALLRSHVLPGDAADAAGATGADQRATMLQCLIEGLLVRAIRQPDLDRDLLRRGLEHALVVLGDWPGDSAGGD
jgi:hypothetical protein